jgi:hypothetical protein
MQQTHDFDQLLAIERLREARTNGEWRAWIDSVLSLLWSTPEGVEFLRFTKGPVKRLKEEVLPTVRLVERLSPQRQVWIEFPCDDGPADALLSLSSLMEWPIPVQVTCDFDYDAQLRLELLHQQGFAPGSGPIARRAGKVYAKHGVYSLDEAVERVLTPLRSRIGAKMKTRHAPGTWLLIHFSDEILPPEGIEPVMDACAQMLVGSPFQAAFVVGNTEENSLCRLVNGSVPEHFL